MCGPKSEPEPEFDFGPESEPEPEFDLEPKSEFESGSDTDTDTDDGEDVVDYGFDDGENVVESDGGDDDDDDDDDYEEDDDDVDELKELEELEGGDVEGFKDVEPVGEDFDDSEGEVKEFQMGRLLNDGEVSKDIVKTLNENSLEVKVGKGLQVDENLVDVGEGTNLNVDGKSENSKRDDVEIVIGGESVKGIEDIAEKLYKGVEYKSLDEKALMSKLICIRRKYNEIDSEIKNINRSGFVEFNRFLFECPNLINIINNLID